MFDYAPITEAEPKRVKRRQSEYTADAATMTANRLSKLGHHKEANDVRKLVKSQSQLRAQVHYLWGELRRIEALEAEARHLLTLRYGPDSPGWKAEQEFRRQSGGGEG